MSSKRPILIIQGAQWGSEAKGMVAAALCERRNVHYAVRTGAVNAGHTVYKDGKRYVMQQLPTGWVAGSNLVIGPGALIHPHIFLTEVAMVRGAGFTSNIWVDYRAGVHLPRHVSPADKHHRIGATGKGCSVALVDRIQRNVDSELFRDTGIGSDRQVPLDWEFADTVCLLNDAYDRGDQILLEGTQGTLLDLYLGPYPYTTHKQCTAAQWVVEAGLSPSLEYEVVLVARTYPIRVAGNSGPMANEIDWPTLALEINKKLFDAGKPNLISPGDIAAFLTAKNNFPESRYADRNVWLSESDRDAMNQLTPSTQQELRKLFEFTTVTKKLRRVARISIEYLKYSVMVNRPAWIALTFLNYEFPEMWGLEIGEVRKGVGDCQARVIKYLNNLQDELGVPIRMASSGPESKHLANV